MTKLKIVRLIAEGIVFIVAVLLAVAVASKDRKISAHKAEMKCLYGQIDSLRKDNMALGSLEGIQVNVEYNLKTTNVLGVNTNAPTFTAREVAVYTRKELLDSLKNNR